MLFEWQTEEGDEGTLGTAAMLGVLAERKKVSDLVGRSFSQDHVKQLQKMRLASETCPTQLFLVEGDPVKAQYTMYVNERRVCVRARALMCLRVYVVVVVCGCGWGGGGRGRGAGHPFRCAGGGEWGVGVWGGGGVWGRGGGWGGPRRAPPKSTVQCTLLSALMGVIDVWLIGKEEIVWFEQGFRLSRRTPVARVYMPISYAAKCLVEQQRLGLTNAICARAAICIQAVKQRRHPPAGISDPDRGGRVWGDVRHHADGRRRLRHQGMRGEVLQCLWMRGKRRGGGGEGRGKC